MVPDCEPVVPDWEPIVPDCASVEDPEVELWPLWLPVCELVSGVVDGVVVEPVVCANAASANIKTDVVTNTNNVFFMNFSLEA